MRKCAVTIPIALGAALLATGLTGCSSSDESAAPARQAAADLPLQGVAICLQNDTSSRFSGTSENTREVDRDLFIGPGEIDCAWWKGASNPKLILQGPSGPDFEVKRSGNSSIDVCGTSFNLPFDSEPGETEQKQVSCSENPYTAKLVLTKENNGALKRLIAVMSDS